MPKKQKKTIKEFCEWLEKENRQNWEIERYVEALLRETIERFIKEMEESFKEQMGEIEEWIEEKSGMALLHPDIEWSKFSREAKRWLRKKIYDQNV